METTTTGPEGPVVSFRGARRGGRDAQQVLMKNCTVQVVSPFLA